MCSCDERYEILRGAIDLHVHADPDVYLARRMDCIELAKSAKEAGMRGFVLKSHHFPTPGLAYLVRKVVPEIEVFGGISLNHPVGGLNVEAVKAASRFILDTPLCKVVWMPTIDSANHISYKERHPSFLQESIPRDTPHVSKKGLSVLKGDRLLPELESILDVIAENHMTLATGHLSVEETKVLVEEATNRKTKKMIVTHVESDMVDMSVDDQKELARKGAFIEHSFCGCTPMFLQTTLAEISSAIKEVGAKHCILVTDFGQLSNPSPVEGLRMFTTSLMAHGIKKQEIQLMVKDNPAFLLGIA